MDFLSNSEKIFITFEIGESYFQKAEGRYPPPRPPTRAAPDSGHL
jgi:hypothetical protein